MSTDSLAVRYSTRVPRYTSFPTAVELTPVRDVQFIHALLRHGGELPVSVYLHIPFCRSLCYFCACHKEIVKDVQIIHDYVRLLVQEIDLVQRFSESRLSMSELHLGGGSPSIVAPSEMSFLLEYIGSVWPGYEQAAKSIELDPRTTSRELLQCLAEHGISRLSFGVQDFNERVMQLVHREQPFLLVQQAVTWARQLGISNINFDLIYGLPGQTVSSIRDTIEKVIDLSPNRLALYGYAHVQWRAHAQRVMEKSMLPSPNLRYALNAEAERLLLKAGYQRIGFDHFARPNDELAVAQCNGKLRRNFMGYTTSNGRAVIGLGASSISDIGGTMYQNYVDRRQYRAFLEQQKLPIEKSLSRREEDIVRAYVIERIMCDGTITLETIEDEFPRYAFGASLFQAAIERLQPMIEDDLVEATAGGLRVTPQGRYFSRHVAAAFDRYLHEKSEQVFSMGC